MRHSQIILIFLILFLGSCQKSDDGTKTNSKGEIEYINYLWKIPIHLDGHDGDRFNTMFGYNMSFGNNVLVSTTNSDDSRNISLVNSETGEIEWNWSEFYQPVSESVSGSRATTDGKFYRWVSGTRHYAIELENGQSALRWRDEPNSSMDSKQTYIESKDLLLLYKTTTNSDGTKSHKLFSTSLLGEDYSPFLELPYDANQAGEDNRVKGIERATHYVHEGKDYLVIHSSQPSPNWFYDSRINLYNMTDNEWVYRDVIAAEAKQSNGGPSKVYNDMYYFTAGKEMFCYDIMSGEQLWTREFPHNFTFSGFEIAENIMIANCENQICYGIDIDNGNIKWNSEGSGTSSQLQSRVMNGVAYFDGGGPAFLFAKDIHTGETLWRLDAHLYENNRPSWHNTLNLVPGKDGEKGKIIVTNDTHLYCFEAAK